MSRRTTVLRSQLVDGLRRPRRVLLMGLAMIVAAFVTFGTVLAARSTERTVVADFAGTPAAVDYVLGASGGADPRVLAAVRELPEVAEAVARTSVGTQLVGEPRPITIAADPGTGPLATVRVVAGRYPSADDEIAVTRLAVERLRLDVGDTTRIEPPVVGGSDDAPDPITLRVVGVVDAPGDGGDTAYTTDAAAVRLSDGWIAQIEVRLAPRADPAAALAALEGVTGGTGTDGQGPTIVSGEETRQAELDAVSDSIDRLFALVGMFVAVTVVAAALVATSTFRIVFAQRMRQLALLRAVGADRGKLLRALVAEGALTGLVAGTVGVTVAYLLGLLLPWVAGLFGVEVVAPGHPFGAAVAVVLGTVLVAVTAVLAPAATAARVAPLEALRTAATAPGSSGVGPLRAVLGVLGAVGALAVAALVVTRLPGTEPQAYDATAPLMLVVLSGTLGYAALVALGPLVVRPVLAALGWPLRRLGPLGRLAVGGVGGAPRRAAAVSVVVALGVTLVTGVLIGRASLEQVIDRELAGRAPADLELHASVDSGVPLPSGVLDRVRAADELTRVVPFRATSDVRVDEVEFDGLDTVDVDLRALTTWADFGAAAGDLEEAGPGRVVLLSAVARAAQVTPGDTVTLTRGDSSVELTVVATLDNTPVSAGSIIHPQDLDRLGLPAAPTALLADVAGDRDRDRTAAVDALRAAGGPDAYLTVLADGRDDLAGSLDRVVGVMLSLIGLTVLVAVVGVGTTTSLSVVERIRESGLLRAVGMSRGRLRLMMTVEAGLYGLIGATLGLLLALPYAALAVRALGANAPVTFPVGQLFLVVVVLATATAVAGLLPARRAARVSPVTALAADG
ncbi:ABC transporter permease [Micromonospora sp. NPDC000207]|uniref:ABC transporter permease n=1 Tax=Micromonospora sp. NPDC000207 TaxID=3154246 RepID=UPI003327964B